VTFWLSGSDFNPVREVTRAPARFQSELAVADVR
jgi:hypothetical protein